MRKHNYFGIYDAFCNVISNYNKSYILGGCLTISGISVFCTGIFFMAHAMDLKSGEEKMLKEIYR